MKKITYKDNDNNLISYSSFLCKDGFILYKIIRKKNRHKVSLSFDPVNKLFIAVCPINYNKEKLDQVVKYMYSYKMKEYVDFKAKKPWVLLGQELKVEIIMGNEFKYQYYGDKLIVYIRNVNEYPLIAKKFLFDFSKIIFTIRLSELLEEVNERAMLSECTWSTRTWGRCWCSERLIELNAFLIQFPLNIADEVIYHEIAHLKVPNHYKPFWDLLETYCPNFDRHDHKAFLLQCEYWSKYRFWMPRTNVITKMEIWLSYMATCK